MKEKFNQFSIVVTKSAGNPWAFIAALLSVIVWGAAGPFFHYSEAWQIVINTATTIVTFLMMFIIQQSQNRDTKAIHIKLDELIKVNEAARNELRGIENLSEDEVVKIST